MSKSISGNQKHLTLSDRCFIEQSLLQGLNFRQMAITLEKDPSTITKKFDFTGICPEKTLQVKTIVSMLPNAISTMFVAMILA